MSKKILCILLTPLLLFSFCSCGKNKINTNTNNPDVQNQPSQTEPVIKEKVLEIEEVYERILYEDSYTKITLKKHQFNTDDPENKFSIYLGVQNKSNGTANIKIETISINDIPTVKKYEQLAKDNIEKILQVHFTKTESNQFDIINIKSIENIEKITFKLYVYNSKNSNNIENIIEYFPNNEEKNAYELVLDEKTPVANERCQVSYMATRTVGDKLHIIIYLENKTKEEMDFTFKNIFVGNQKIKEEFKKTVGAGMTSYSTLIVQTEEETLDKAKEYTIQVVIPSDEENIMLISKPITFPINKS